MTVAALSLGLATVCAGALTVAVLPSSNATNIEHETTVNPEQLALFEGAAQQCAQQQGNTWNCLSNLVENRGPLIGVATTLEGIRQAISDYPEAFAENCHQNAHQLGEYAGSTFASVTQALEAGGPDCQFGYYHGVIEGHARVTPTLWEELPTLCQLLSTDTNSYVYQECSHSLGHAVVTRTDNDVDAGVEKCRLMPLPADQSACATGVFMSWSNTLDKMLLEGKPLEGKWTWADPNARWTKCPEFDDLMAGACVLFFAETAPHTHEGLGAFRTWCHSALGERKSVLEQCHRGIGRSSAGYEEFESMGRWPGIIAFCNDGTSYEYARLCAETAYVVAAGFQLSPNLPDQVCRAWQGSIYQDEQCAVARELFATATKDAGPLTGARQPEAERRE